MNLYEKYFTSEGKKISILIDPDKQNPEQLKRLIEAAEKAKIDFFTVGGSLISVSPEETVETVKNNSDIPVILFPGSILQINNKADGILLISLISGRNPDFLIGNHVIAAPFLKKSSLEIISVGYMLIDGGVRTAVEYISNTIPIPYEKNDIAVATAVAGEMTGKKCIYMDAGSGAQKSISTKMISEVKANIDIPLIIGGGIRDAETLKNIFAAGADIAVIGTIIEQNPKLLNEFSKTRFEI
jgi:putative glycerol-1-phosphate prenyltransferase